MPRYLIEYGAGHRIVQKGRTLMDAKMKLCKYLMADWKCPVEGARTMKLIEVLSESEEKEGVA